MQDAATVGMLYRFGQLDKEGRGLWARHRCAPLFQPFCQRDARAIGGSDVTDSPDFTGFVHRHQVDMIQGAGRARFLLEAGTQIGSDQCVSPRHLKSHLAAQLRVKGEEHDTEAATA